MLLFYIISLLCKSLHDSNQYPDQGILWTLIITILDIIHALSFIQNNVSETGFYLRLHVVSTQLGPVDRASLCLRTLN
jgi:hypothetical protein